MTLGQTIWRAVVLEGCVLMFRSFSGPQSLRKGPRYQA
jgi:hypothetical protein